MGKPVGQIFAELDLDTTKYTKSQQRILSEAKSTALNVERNWSIIGQKSDIMYDAMRQRIKNAYEMIANNAKSSSQEIVRAKEAAAAKIKQIDEQQFGHQTSMLETIKKNWLATTAVIYGAMRTAQAGWDLMGTAADYQERVNSLDALGRQYRLTGDQILEAMQDGARGLISLKDASDMAAKAMTLGLNPKQMIEFTRVAETLSDAVGGSVKEGFDRMTTAAVTGRTMTLAQMGVIVDLEAAYKKYGRELSEAEKQQVNLNVILAEAKKKADALGESVDTDRDRMDRWVATIDDLKMAFGELLLPLTKIIEAETRGIQGLSLLLGIGKKNELIKERMGILEDLDKAEIKLAQFNKYPSAYPWVNKAINTQQARVDKLKADLAAISSKINPPGVELPEAKNYPAFPGMNYAATTFFDIKNAPKQSVAKAIKTDMFSADQEAMIRRMGDAFGYTSSKTAEAKLLISDMAEKDYENLSKSLDSIRDKYKDVFGYTAAQMAEAKQLISDIGAQGEKTFNEDLKNAVTGWASDFGRNLNELVWGADIAFSNIAESFGKMITQMIIQEAIVRPFLKMFQVTSPAGFSLSNIFKMIGGRASGGSVAGGSSYLVGEKGPEIFSPNVSGMITANDKISGQTVNKTERHYHLEGSTFQDQGQLVQALQTIARQEVYENAANAVNISMDRNHPLRSRLLSGRY